MRKDELNGLAESLHKQFGKKFHSPKEALRFILPIWENDNQIAYAVLLGMASSGVGKKKSHASVEDDSGEVVSYSGSGGHSRNRSHNLRVR